MFSRLPARPSTDAALSFFDDGSGIGAGDSCRFDKIRSLAPMISCPKPRRQDTPSVQSTLSHSPMVCLPLVSLLLVWTGFLSDGCVTMLRCCCDDAVLCCVVLLLCCAICCVVLCCKLLCREGSTMRCAVQQDALSPVARLIHDYEMSGILLQNAEDSFADWQSKSQGAAAIPHPDQRLHTAV